ncbi:apolipoprotein N-acyltransferase [Corynebacterium guangdongense]|uniref:Apolipoprotein N-acyltransferase n=1 Tax=Corynebacterium guangdongense TaxID=1783348 RepID=A0ABU1ZWP2_9CORY|nr:apolipoprotein N-acyltransferase [Corynebacterium guangdongense]MDR7329325.1 apolipoprotein N-acyltransferase [Corynebacterium guangdongense]WJZ17890.1 Apolipoprotein N-acyltransferase [Corynebacterium guangdongense]
MWFLLARLALAATSGVLVFASFEPIGWWLCGVLGIALLYFTLMRWPWRGGDRPTLRQGPLLGFVHGLVLYLMLLPWVGEFVGTIAHVGLAVTCALYALITGWAGTAIARWRWGWAAFPFLYVAVEFARSSWPFGGFAWVRLAWGQINGPLANLAAWGGPALVSLAAALVATGLVAAFLRDQRAVGSVTALGLVAVGLVAGLGVNRPDATVGEVEVAAIQGNVPRMGLDFNAQRRAVLGNHVRVTEELAASGARPDLVIWPENSSDVNPFADAEAARLINRAVDAIDAPILVGTITRDQVGDRNTMQVFDPETGVGEYHNKIYLQPFGEWMPFREVFRIFSPYVDAAGDFKPGDGDGTVTMGGVTLGVATCYEVIFDDAYRDAVRNGATLLTTPTNNATFGFTDMTYQQLSMSRMRAIETDRAVVVAATSGVSAIVHPDGSVSQKTRIFEPNALVETLPLREGVTLAVRYGDWIQIAIVMMGLVLGIAALFLNRGRSTGPRAATKKTAPAAARKTAHKSTRRTRTK